MKQFIGFCFWMLSGLLCAGIGYLDGKHSADRWYAQHWHPDIRFTDVLDPKTPCIIHDGQTEPPKTPLSDAIDKLDKGIELLGKQTELNRTIERLNEDCLRVEPEVWEAHRCEIRVRNAEHRLNQLEIERKAINK